MKPKTAKTLEWQCLGGKFEIPDGWFVHNVDLDATDPYAEITNQKDSREERKILIPKSLAYSLGTHFCGSKMMRNLIREDMRREIKNTIKEAMGM